jgi:hypothetical protein
MALVDFMRLSLTERRTRGLSSAAWQEIRVRSGRDDKGEGGFSIESDVEGSTDSLLISSMWASISF